MSSPVWRKIVAAVKDIHLFRRTHAAGGCTRSAVIISSGLSGIQAPGIDVAGSSRSAITGAGVFLAEYTSSTSAIILRPYRL